MEAVENLRKYKDKPERN